MALKLYAGDAPQRADTLELSAEGGATGCWYAGDCLQRVGTLKLYAGGSLPKSISPPSVSAVGAPLCRHGSGGFLEGGSFLQALTARNPLPWGRDTKSPSTLSATPAQNFPNFFGGAREFCTVSHTKSFVGKDFPTSSPCEWFRC